MNKKWIFLGVLALCIIGYAVFRYVKKQEDMKQEVIQKQKAQTVFAPVFKVFDDNISANQHDTIYDIDKTIRVIHEIDEAIKKTDNLEEYLLIVAKQDYRNVAPDVLAARKKLMQTVMEIYAKQKRLEEQPDYWDLIRQYTLAAGTSIDIKGLASPIPTDIIKYNPETTRKTYEKFLESQEVSKEIKEEILSMKSRLLNQLFEYSEVYYKYYDQWDKICLHRDKAYLAMKNAQFDIVEQEADKAIALAPFEREAHILKGLAKVAKLAKNKGIAFEASNNPQEVLAFLDKFIDKNPDYSAPALLLKGVYYEQLGQINEAKIAFEESAAYFPKQADKLQNNFDPYKMRPYLRKSKEGNIITEAYRTTMLGGGFFTPDLQLAKLHYKSNNIEAGRAKVLDHFARRRNQSQWDYILSDIAFCEQSFGKEFQKILPEQTFLKLEVDPAIVGDKLNLSIVNSSGRRLNNVSLILCVQFTDMLRDDYQAIKVSKTLPAILPHQSNDFGKQEVVYEFQDKKKGIEDIVNVRAIVISDEAVSWVDTEEFKFERIKKQRDELKKLKPEEYSQVAKEFGFNQAQIIDLLKKNAKIKVSESKLSINDLVSIELPKELAFLAPIFRMTSDGEVMIEPSKNALDKDAIALDFKFNKFNQKTEQGYSTKIYTKFGDFDIQWGKDKNGNFSISNVTYQ
ncbi:MAG: hypothetical protein MUE53_02580 [Chitinophagales bacterium]|jgi:tetratricopeptide (TPR) repeat protein|nr:hypothetical protein [Chitinophagales bacterium]